MSDMVPTPPSLEGLQAEVSEYKDKYLRTLAELENSRKRLVKEREELTKLAVERLLAAFLPPIDHFENALRYVDQLSDEMRTWALGFQMILDQFKQVLAEHHVVPFVSVGKPFDPHRHDAVEIVPTDEVAPGMVMEEFFKGYQMGDRIVRHARVKVSAAPEENNSEDNDNG
jgi:molecular chaperone GrpE